MVKKTALWALVIGWMGVIFSFSAQNNEQSNELSSSVLDRIISFFAVNADEEAIEFLSVLIRKIAHFSIYMILGILLFLLIRAGYGIKGRRSVILPAFVSLLYAFTDEFHQVFVSGRSGQITDVIIDFFGSAGGILVSVFIGKVLERRRK